MAGAADDHHRPAADRAAVLRGDLRPGRASSTGSRPRTRSLALANDTRYGLNAMLFTENLSRAHRVASQLRAGTVWVNCFFIRDLRTPFGGVGDSGVGREGGTFSAGVLHRAQGRRHADRPRLSSPAPPGRGCRWLGAGWTYAVPPAPVAAPPAAVLDRAAVPAGGARIVRRPARGRARPGHARRRRRAAAEPAHVRPARRPTEHATASAAGTGHDIRAGARDPRRDARHHAARHPRALRGRPRHRRPGGRRGLRRPRRAPGSCGTRPTAATRSTARACRCSPRVHFGTQLRQRLLGRHADGLRRRRRRDLPAASPAASTSSGTSSPTASPSTPRAWSTRASPAPSTSRCPTSSASLVKQRARPERGRRPTG